MTYLREYLFKDEQARQPVRTLSGGERNRLLLAKLFAKPSNLLVLDEPTNDLDIETLELLEELLGGYRGTLLLVSHDREFLDNVVTSSLVLEGNGRVGEYVGGYSDWLRQRPSAHRSDIPVDTNPIKPEAPQGAATGPATKARLGFNEKRELEALPRQIEILEARIAELGERMQDPAFYRQESAVITAAHDELAAAQAELDAAYERWEALEALR
jgi:ATP-binding cassette subfamily F protein uup